jgi:hypothetical protein
MNCRLDEKLVPTTRAGTASARPTGRTETDASPVPPVAATPLLIVASDPGASAGICTWLLDPRYMLTNGPALPSSAELKIDPDWAHTTVAATSPTTRVRIYFTATVIPG